jgi:hypothetical protein
MKHGSPSGVYLMKIPDFQTSLTCSLVRNVHNVKSQDAIPCSLVKVTAQLRQRWEMSIIFLSLLGWGETESTRYVGN